MISTDHLGADTPRRSCPLVVSMLPLGECHLARSQAHWWTQRHRVGGGSLSGLCCRRGGKEQGFPDCKRAQAGLKDTPAPSAQISCTRPLVPILTYKQWIWPRHKFKWLIRGHMVHLNSSSFLKLSSSFLSLWASGFSRHVCSFLERRYRNKGKRKKYVPTKLTAVR